MAARRNPSKGMLLDGRRIMVVEDEAILALDMALTLGDAGGEVIGPFYRLSAAMDEDLDGLDGAVLDLDLNGKEALPLANRLRERGIPTVFHTGRWPIDADAYPQVAICAKPCITERVVRRLSGLIAACDARTGGGLAPEWARGRETPRLHQH